MKEKRLLSLLFGLVLCVWLLPEVAQAATTTHKHPSCGAACTHEENHNIESFTGISSISTLYNGNYFLKEDFETADDIIIKGNVKLCLNGHSIFFTDSQCCLDINEGASLEVCDCIGTGSICREVAQSNGGSMAVYNDGTLTIYGGNYFLNGQGYLIQNSGILTIWDGAFGIGLDNSGTATIHSATFDHPNSNFNMLIQNNSSAQLTINDISIAYAYTAFRNGGTATINGGSFRSTASTSSGSSCISNYSGGKLYIYGDTEIVAEHCSAVDNSGTVYLYGGTLSGGKNGFEENRTQAGIYNRTTYDGTVASAIVHGGTISGSPAIYNCGYSKNATCSIDDGTIIGGIRNSVGYVVSTYGTSSTKTYYPGKLTIAHKEGKKLSIDKITLEYPDALTCNYQGKTPINLEIKVSDFFEIGDVVYCGTALPTQFNLEDDSYVMQYSSNNVVLANSYCGAEGTNGENLKWKLSSDGTLTISGSGKMKNYNTYINQPWEYSKTKTNVKEVVISSDVTSIGNAAFSYLSELEKVVIPEGVTEIGSWAFEGGYIEEIFFPASLTKIGRNIFMTEPKANTKLPSKISYAGCVHQWNKIQIEEQVNAPFIPTSYKLNINQDDGDCTTALLCSVCGGVDIAARDSHSFTTKPSGELASEATYTEAAKYYVQCDHCDAIDRTKTVSVGEPKQADPGDLDMDGNVTSVDLVLLAEHLLGRKTLTEAQQKLADLNGDGLVTAADMVLLVKLLLR